MSNLPPVWYDACVGDKREGCHKLPAHPSSVSTSHLEIFNNTNLMLPSERLREHQKLKEGIAEWKKGRSEIFEYKKQKRVLDRNHKDGIVGIDGPVRSDTELYRERFLAYQAQDNSASQEQRHDHLAEMRRSSDALVAPYGQGLPEPGELPRSIEIPLQRKDVDPKRHPYRFFDTYKRLWPSSVPRWDPHRAMAMRSHQLREKHYDIVNGADNSLKIRACT